METANWQEIEEAKKAALEVLLHNAHGPYLIRHCLFMVKL
jgi:hypothetical protein